jgi:hypothetical protein
MPILGIIASSILKVTNSYESIATVTVGSGGASSITFSSIPSTYKHLQIRAIQSTVQGTDRGNSQLFARFNSDTGTNYSWHQLKGNNSSATATGYFSEDTIYGSDTLYSGGAANVFGAMVMDILDYADTNKYKTVRILNGFDSNSATTGNTSIALNSGLWRNTAAISTITIPNNGFNFKEFSQFALYGVKG